MGKTGKILLNALIFLIVIGFAWYMMRSVNKEETTYVDTPQEEPFDSPYQSVLSFTLPDEINRMELYEGHLYVAAGQSLYVYDTSGKEQTSFRTKAEVRDIAVSNDEVYVLYPALIEVYSLEGNLLREWEACSDLSDYCSLALAGDFVFVTDAENKNLCKYTREGNFLRFIRSPHGFIIPSYSFDIESRSDTLYVANSGRHLIESYNLNGGYISAFGTAGSEAGSFVGCCNPAFIAFTPEGDLLTSEKGIPRVSLFTRDGAFKKALLNSRLLDNGSKACEVAADGDKLYVGGGKKVTVYQLKMKTYKSRRDDTLLTVCFSLRIAMELTHKVPQGRHINI